MTDRLKDLSDAGCRSGSTTSRERIETGNLAELVREQARRRRDDQPDDLRGPRSPAASGTTSRSPARRQGRPVDRVVFELTTEDVRNACDIMRPVHQAGRTTDGSRSRSSPVSPTTPRDDRVGARAVAAVDRPTRSSRSRHPRGPAGRSRRRSPRHQRQRHADLRRARYREVMDAYLTGLRLADGAATFHDPLGRVVLRVPRGHRGRQAARVDRVGRHLALRGKAAVANALVAYGAFSRWSAPTAGGT